MQELAIADFALQHSGGHSAVLVTNDESRSGEGRLIPLGPRAEGDAERGLLPALTPSHRAAASR